jgi:succinyl-CoA synthetase beta subunit
MAEYEAGRSTEINININGGMATANDIAETTVNALRQYNQVHGPIPIAIG